MFTPSNVTPATKIWLDRASPEMIGHALEIGIAALTHTMSLMTPVEPKTQVPTCIKGQLGEADVEAALASKWEVKNVAHEAKSGDLTLLLPGTKIVIEVKNYQGVVPSPGVEKFRRDLATSGASGGVFVSLGSPIACITSDFAMRFENVGSQLIPCVYIVKPSPGAIHVAVGMVTEWISMSSKMTSDLQSQDMISSVAGTIIDGIEGVARIRHDLQSLIPDIANRVIKTTCDMVRTETILRGASDSLRSGLSYVALHNPNTIEADLSKIANYVRQPDNIKCQVRKLMGDLRSVASAELGASMWKFHDKKCVHGCGVSFIFYAKKVEVMVTGGKIPSRECVELLAQHNNKVTISGGTVSLDIDPSTIEIISYLLREYC